MLYAASKEGDKHAYEPNLNDLKTASKSEFYGKCDKRLQSFIDNLTDRALYKTENSNFKSNIYENMLKARNSKYTSKTGLKVVENQCIPAKFFPSKGEREHGQFWKKSSQILKMFANSQHLKKHFCSFLIITIQTKIIQHWRKSSKEGSCNSSLQYFVLDVYE